ncbi:MAG: glycosyltransferase family 4 protein [Oceanospirillales bacterium]|nr:glycosyltransferase family 4 protein [Oceanospirillales bacterium]
MSVHPPLAFYAPLKPPTHPNPSGDRLIATRLIHTLGLAGFNVELASTFRSYDGKGDINRQRRLSEIGNRLAERLIRRYRALPSAQRPRIWFTYHLYHKAPDWIGPKVCKALSIPYVVAEASYAGKQQRGPWALSLKATETALQQAALVISLNPTDQEGVGQLVPSTRMHYLAPYLDLTPYISPSKTTREVLAARYNLDNNRVWLISVAMMRPGDKSESYRLLAESIRLCEASNVQLILVGGGKSEKVIHQYFSGLSHVSFTGLLTQKELIPLLQAADLMVWPAVNEAFGMSLLEAQACSTWVIAGGEGGVASVVHDGESGTLIPARNTQLMAKTINAFATSPERLSALGEAARTTCIKRHDETIAVTRLRTLLMPLATERTV